MSDSNDDTRPPSPPFELRNADELADSFQSQQLAGPAEAPPFPADTLPNSQASPKGSRSYRRKTEAEVIRGEVLKVRFTKPEDGFVIFELKPPPGTVPTVVVGTARNLSPGIEVALTGEFITHRKFGTQFKASNIAVVPPSSKAGIIKYLSSGVIPGIGEKLAERVVTHFGTKTLDILERSPERIKEVNGVGGQKAKAILEYLEENSSLHEITRFLSEHQISTGLSQRIYKKYGTRSIEKLKQNPYLLARDLIGVGFQTADSVAIRLGIAPDSLERHRAGLIYTLERSRDDGHCFLPKQALIEATETLLGVTPAYEQHEQQLQYLRDSGVFVLEEDRVYLHVLATAETWVAEFVHSRMKPRSKPLLDELETQGSVKRVEKATSISFSSEQRSAVDAALQYKLLVLTGGPGCGKTTVTRAIVESLLEAKCNLVLTAPTGRAAQRLSQVCKASAKTIHRLLRFDPFAKRFFHGLDNPLENDGEPVDAVIVDEASMIDLPLAHALFSAIPKGATLILVGDKDQLPSVGPGRVFGELLSIPEVPTVTLSQLYRRDDASLINDIAYQINAGITPSIPAPDGVTKTDAYFIERDDAHEAAKVIERLFVDQIPKKFGIATDDITVLTPSNRGALGTQSLNARLQAAIQGLGEDSEFTAPFLTTTNDRVFYEGDRVVQRKNNYQIDDQGVFNGDIGTVRDLDSKEGILNVNLWDGREIEYIGKDLQQLMLAYCLTVHRSQGSEIPCVILALHESHYTLLERQLVYTGLTRAKKLLIVVGSKRALFLASKRSQSKKRFSTLAEKIQAQLSSS